MTGGLRKTDKLGGTQIHGKDHMKGGAELPLCYQSQRTRRAVRATRRWRRVERYSPRAFKKTWHAHALIAGVWPQEQWENTCLLVEPSQFVVMYAAASPRKWIHPKARGWSRGTSNEKLGSGAGRNPVVRMGMSTPGPKGASWQECTEAACKIPPGQDAVRAQPVQKTSKPQRDCLGDPYSMSSEGDPFYNGGYWGPKRGSGWPKVLLLDRTSPGPELRSWCTCSLSLLHTQSSVNPAAGTCQEPH